MFFRILEQILTGMCFFGLNMLLLGLMAGFRNLPAILQAVGRAVRWISLQFYRAYRVVLNGFSPTFQHFLGVDILGQYPRVGACCLFSLTLYLITALVFQWQVSLLWLALTFAHGVYIGLTWDQLEQPSGLRLGERLE